MRRSFLAALLATFPVPEVLANPLCEDVNEAYADLLSGSHGRSAGTEALAPRVRIDDLHLAATKLERLARDGTDGPALRQALDEYLKELRAYVRRLKEREQHARANGLAGRVTDARPFAEELARLERLRFRRYHPIGKLYAALWDRSGASALLDRHYVGRLREIERGLHERDYRSPEFRRLALEKLRLLEKFRDAAELQEYAKAFAKVFQLDSRLPVLQLHPETALEREILASYGANSAFARLPGTPAQKLARARERLRESEYSAERHLDVDGETGLPVLKRGNPEVFVAAETLSLYHRANPEGSLSPEEARLADAYEATVAALRGRDWTLPAEKKEIDRNRLGLLASMLLGRPLPQTGEGPYYIPAAEEGGPLDEFVADRLRYLVASDAGGPADARLRDWIDRTRDIREMQYHEHWTDRWWVAESRAKSTYTASVGGVKPLTIQKGQVNNSAWQTTYGNRAGYVIGADNVPNGDSTAELINGRGLYRDSANVLHRSWAPGRTRITRAYDPVQREAPIPGQTVGAIPGHPLSQPRTTGWIEVAEVPLGESGNPALRELKTPGGPVRILRRSFWNEAMQDGADQRSPVKPGALGAGELRIAQQSVPFSELLKTLPENDPMRRLAPAALAKAMEQRFGHLGEVDAVRGELVTNIEALYDRNGVVTPLQWNWDAKKREWVPSEYTLKSHEKEEKDRTPMDHLLFSCQVCHAKKSMVRTMAGRCALDSRPDGYFYPEARRKLQQERDRGDGR